MVKEVRFTGERKPKASDIITRDMTIHMNKRLFNCTFKNRAPRAVREIKKFAQKAMGTSDVRVSTDLNKAIWANGVKGVAKRLRLRLSRKRNDNEDAKEVLYTHVDYVNVDNCKLQTEIVEA
jgi:large subunit ribosomal protein L31e